MWEIGKGLLIRVPSLRSELSCTLRQPQDGSLSGTIDYPDESASGALITGITYKEPAFHFESTSGQVSYDGMMNKENSEIAGTWKQGAAALSLTLKKTP